MSLPDIPEHVLQFLAEKIDTVPQLEALLLLWENPGRAWSQGEISARIYVAAETAVSVLQALQRRQLISIEGEDAAQYRYEPSWDSAGLMEQVAAAYRRHLIPVATFIHSKASPSVREFARAFDLKKDR